LVEDASVQEHVRVAPDQLLDVEEIHPIAHAHVAPDRCNAARADASVAACTSPKANGTSATIINNTSPSSGTRP
jgi:hypothetical protein